MKAKDFDKKFDNGEDIIGDLDNPKAHRQTPQQELVSAENLSCREKHKKKVSDYLERKWQDKKAKRNTKS